MNRPFDRPTAPTGGPQAWGSDLIVDLLRGLGIEYIAMVPGASFRGLHDSLVNYGGNQRPEIILCNHEMISVAVARGYTRVTGRPMAVALHNLVGLANAGAAIYDAWVDRIPVLLIGANGPMDAARRRPWIDWIHTANGQTALFRDFTKWDDQPASVAAFSQSLLRAHQIAVTEPGGPVYVSFDASHQEQALPEPVALPEFERYGRPSAISPDPTAIGKAAELLVEARLPIAFAGIAGRDRVAFDALRDLAELLAMPVIDSGYKWHSFPTPHEMDFEGLEFELTPESDVVLVLDGEDMSEHLRAPGSRRVISISLAQLSARGFSGDHEALSPADVSILAGLPAALPAVVDECRRRLDDGRARRVMDRREQLLSRQQALAARRAGGVETAAATRGISSARLVAETWQAVRDEDFVFTSGSLRKLAPGVVRIERPNQNVGGVGGGVVGDHAGMALGACLALRDSDRFPVAIVGDGDLLMAPQTLWTAAHHGLRGLWVVQNNHSYGNDEHHQETIARDRDRPVANKGIGIRMDKPPVDFAALARSLGVEGIGPIKEPSELAPGLRKAVEVVRGGGTVVLDVWID